MAKPLAKISHLDLYGRRTEKYDILETLSVQDAKWTELEPVEPYYFFVPKDFGGQEEYDTWIKLDKLFPIWNSGIKTDRDELFIDGNKDALMQRIQKLLLGDIDSGFIEKYNVKDSGSYKITEKIKYREFDQKYIQKIKYRPFDDRFIYYDKKIISRPADKVMRHLMFENLSLSLKRQCKFDFSYAFIHRNLCESCLFESAYANNSEFPLYLYSDSDNLENQIRTPNLDQTIWSAINTIVGETTPEQILDYIYAILHSPSYRKKYQEFLQIDFPRVPYPRDRETFFALVALGGELRSLHLLESPKVEERITSYPTSGDNVVENVKFVDEKVFINATQYFGGVSESVWTHPIGGYMPAQKWLKDRKGRTLTNDDIMHYQRMIVALSETARVMEEVDKRILL